MELFILTYFLPDVLGDLDPDTSTEGCRDIAGDRQPLEYLY